MREILFKAKRINNEEWVYGNYAFTDTNGEQHFIFQNKAFEFEVIPETICQYTGLTDKNGNKIWENDIIWYFDDLADKDKLDRIKFNETHASFTRLHKSKMGLQYLYISESFANRVEVIGNIFDNPELLEGGA